MKLLIKIPTRQRVEKFFKLLDICIQRLSGEHDYSFLISSDTDDLSMNNEDVKSRLDSYKNLLHFYSARDTKIGACNRDMDKVPDDWDVVVLISDDMMPVVDNWDKYILDSMKEHFPDTDGVLWFYDGHQADINTVSILGNKYYKRFGYIYYPEYRSFYCDDEHTIVARSLKKQKRCHFPYCWNIPSTHSDDPNKKEITLIEHQHYSFSEEFTKLPKHIKKLNPLKGADQIQIENRPDIEHDAELFRQRGIENYGL